MTSIRRNLLVALLTAMTVVVVLSALATFHQVRQETDAIFDYHLRQLALTLRDQTFNGESPPQPSSDELNFDFVIQVWDHEGIKLYFSQPATELPDRAQFGFSTVHTSQGDWRVYGTPIRDNVIQVAQPLRIRYEMAYMATIRMLVPVLLLVPTLALLIWMFVGRSLVPLDRLALAVTSRTATMLDPLSERQVPIEVLPLVRSLNGLLDRLGHALQTQRAFVADAAHALRTPLTALQLQAQLVERADNDASRTDAISELKDGLLRMTHVIQQLLTLARAEPDSGARAKGTTDLVQLARLTVGELSHVAVDKKIDIGAVTPDGSILVCGETEVLHTLISNLLENSIHYTPTGGRADVSVGIIDGRPYLEVEDSGPGIPASERMKVFDRFYRCEGTTEPGTGLGLAIVKAISDSYGATIELYDSPLGGLAARVIFPRIDANNA
jgi:two-component system OmpR family sensor kinase